MGIDPKNFFPEFWKRKRVAKQFTLSRPDGSLNRARESPLSALTLAQNWPGAAPAHWEAPDVSVNAIVKE
jgi:hypothetical protein